MAAKLLGAYCTVRNESELNHIREYIRNNPIQWELDKLNPGYITNNDKK